ncbi:zinc-binding dehydrogenase [Amaricoccus solimangrovi]|uniref:Zinc-binding dehydrogenase n=2 Tax=Amaricoccus solimangrovi TaxID=2589815 RepID=A0A501WTX8_9RHOB|nr:zinc-binding dehydrogenase [Amaricoccus solimangrovi]
MRAAVIDAPGRARIETLPCPSPGPGEVLVRLEGCGVCASNLVPWSGPEWMRFPTEPGGLGHEAWGRIAALGPGVAGLELGQRVATLGQNGFATHQLVAAEAVVPLPPELDGMPFPGEAFACAMNIFRRAGITAGDWVAVVGVGFIGAALTRLAAAAGARVIGVSRRDAALGLAREMGAEHVARFDAEAHETVGRLTGHRFCDVAIECVGNQSALDLASGLVATGGRLVIAGYHQDGPRSVDMQSWNWRGIDVINAHERDPKVYLRGLREAVQAARDGLLDPRALVTDAFPLDRLDAALDAQRDRPGALVKAYVRCD